MKCTLVSVFVIQMFVSEALRANPARELDLRHYLTDQLTENWHQFTGRGLDSISIIENLIDTLEPYCKPLITPFEHSTLYAIKHRTVVFNPNIFMEILGTSGASSGLSIEKTLDRLLDENRMIGERNTQSNKRSHPGDLRRDEKDKEFLYILARDEIIPAFIRGFRRRLETGLETSSLGALTFAPPSTGHSLIRMISDYATALTLLDGIKSKRLDSMLLSVPWNPDGIAGKLLSERVDLAIEIFYNGIGSALAYADESTFKQAAMSEDFIPALEALIKAHGPLEQLSPVTPSYQITVKSLNAIHWLGQRANRGPEKRALDLVVIFKALFDNDKRVILQTSNSETTGTKAGVLMWQQIENVYWPETPRESSRATAHSQALERFLIGLMLGLKSPVEEIWGNVEQLFPYLVAAKRTYGEDIIYALYKALIHSAWRVDGNKLSSAFNARYAWIMANRSLGQEGAVATVPEQELYQMRFVLKIIESTPPEVYSQTEKDRYRKMMLKVETLAAQGHFIGIPATRAQKFLTSAYGKLQSCLAAWTRGPEKMTD